MDGDPVRTEDGRAFERDEATVIVGAELGADATDCCRVALDEFAAGVVAESRRFLDRLEAVDGDALTNDPLNELDHRVAAWERRVDRPQN